MTSKFLSQKEIKRARSKKFRQIMKKEDEKEVCRLMTEESVESEEERLQQEKWDEEDMKALDRPLSGRFYMFDPGFFDDDDSEYEEEPAPDFFEDDGYYYEEDFD